MGLLERIRISKEPEETPEEKTAHEALEIIEEKISQISHSGSSLRQYLHSWYFQPLSWHWSGLSHMIEFQ